MRCRRSTAIKLDPTRQSPTVHPSELIAQLLREQSTLTAVEEFSSWHRTHSEPEQAQYYRNLLPIAMPGPGQQLAFEVDLDKCSGCKACVVACHSLNGLDEGESFRDVGLLLAPTTSLAQFQHVTTACHHCVDPGCLSACPVNAYEKDPITGIVKHLDDQCFGCQYCTLACPYEVPKYHAAKGIVRKCDMCTQRLSAGEAPACVQACPHQAIMIRTIDIATARVDAMEGEFLPDSPDPNITIPTTRFVGKAATNPSMRAGTYAAQPLEHAHWPLIMLLVLSQVAVGIVCTALVLNTFAGWDQWLTSRTGPPLGDITTGGPAQLIAAGPTLRTGLLAIAAVIAVISALSSTLHLGRPQFAYRAILGIRHSWLSREIVAFGTFIPLCFMAAALSWTDSRWLTMSLIAAATSGIAGVSASVMVYHVTRRPFWNACRSAPAFAAAAIGVGAMFVLWMSQFTSSGLDGVTARALACTAAICAVVKLLMLQRLSVSRGSCSVHVRTGSETRAAFQQQAAGGIVAMTLSMVLALWPTGTHVMLFSGMALVSAVGAEFTERYLFFRAVVPLRMPGVMKS